MLIMRKSELDLENQQGTVDANQETTESRERTGKKSSRASQSGASAGGAGDSPQGAMEGYSAYDIERGDSRASSTEHPHGVLPYRVNRPLGIVLYYGLDWLATIAIGITCYFSQLGTHTERFYLETDYSFMYPYHEDTISVALLAVLGCVVPIIIVIFVEAFFFWRMRAWPVVLDMHHFALSFFQAHTLVQLITIVLKRYVGRLRPSAFARQTDSIGGWNEAYPSGHTSMIFTGMIFLALFLSGKFGVFSSHGILSSIGPIRQADPFRGSYILGLLFVVAPVSLALYVATSRLVDYAHDFSDVNAGAVLGAFGAWFAYNLSYPSISDPRSALPRPLAHLHRFEKDWIQYYLCKVGTAENNIPLQSAPRRTSEAEMAGLDRERS